MLKDDKDHELESCSKLANLEVRRFHQQRLSEMKETLVQVSVEPTFAQTEAVNGHFMNELEMITHILFKYAW
jgi:hypothetical protein